MRRIATALIPAVLAAAAPPVIAGDAPVPGAARPSVAPFSPDECAVFARELSFARSVEQHDAAAFAEHVAPDAAFAVGSPRPQRGRDAIVRGWGAIIRGEGIRLEWYPERTTAVGDIAWSTGPALSETNENGATVYRRGTFQSVWRRSADGTWQVVFDGGTPPRTVDADDATAFRKARPTACPGA